MEDNIETKAKKRSGRSKALIGLFGLGAIILVVASWNVMFDVEVKPSRRFLQAAGIVKPTPTPEPAPTAESLAVAVVPDEGYEVKIKWGKTGKELVRSGAIDLKKFSENYEDASSEDELKYLTEEDQEKITVNSSNAYFWVNTLWALGLTQKSDVLDKGVMGTQYRKELATFASTAGWTLGKKKGVDLYSSAKIIDLSDEEQGRVAKISANIYRPCCGNSTAFPDCNHGMAILGLVELMVDQEFGDEEIYKAALAFNSYWFPQTYIDLAYYFKTKEKLEWKDIDAKKVLGAQYSSAQGYKGIKQLIQGAPTLQKGGSSCGA